MIFGATDEDSPRLLRPLSMLADTLSMLLALGP